ncbi:MAG: MIP family channel protein [Dehalococcoidia bacterium]
MTIQLGFEPGDFNAKTWRAVAAEFIGTGMFVFIGTGAVVAASASLVQVSGTSPLPLSGFVIAIALAHGLGILLAVAATANISGGHINPAVTFAAMMTGKLRVSTGLLYIAAQIGAAILAVLLVKGIVAGPMELGLGAHGINVFDKATGTGILEDQVGAGAGAALLLEAAMTFALVFVVFATAIDPKGPRHLAPVAIGLVIMADHFIGVPMTGASMNPARSFGPAVVANIWTDHWIYWLGPLIGAGLAALVYEFVFLQRPDDEAA